METLILVLRELIGRLIFEVYYFDIFFSFEKRERTNTLTFHLKYLLISNRNKIMFFVYITELKNIAFALFSFSYFRLRLTLFCIIVCFKIT